ncbi:NAD(P)H-dependent oxidoreductase [Streptomyces sp. NBC_00859]|uniref:NAD(P)H-dependent oxidoreductase n=1 Tax=Streptomyces sp. NBC_00859 TaxID=2903682 RepID=UPI00386F15D7
MLAVSAHVERLVGRADTVLVGAPIYNFAVPAALEVWVDRVGSPLRSPNPAPGTACRVRPGSW